MNYAFGVYRFFSDHWGETREAAELAVALWIIIGGLAPKLADRLRGVRDRGMKALKLK